MGSSVTVSITNQIDLERIARILASAIPSHAMITLEGDLGAGKTTFTKFLGAAIGIPSNEIVSPTFGLIHIHQGPTQLTHIDAFRLSGVEDLEQLGWDEIISQCGWVIVEWPSRIALALPDDRLTVSIEVTGETSRRITLFSESSEFDGAIDALLIATHDGRFMETP